MGNLTKNFSVKEFLISEEFPTLAAKVPLTKSDRMKFYVIAKYLLQPIRDKFGQPIKINSGKRSKVLNLAVGGSRSSDHRFRNMAGAVDFCFASGDQSKLWQVFFFVNKTCRYSFGQQIIYIDNAGKPRFIHLSLPTDKHQTNALVNDPNGFRAYNPGKDPKE